MSSAGLRAALEHAESLPFFPKAGAYKIGVRRDLFSLLLGPVSHLRVLKNNKRMESMSALTKNTQLRRRPA